MWQDSIPLNARGGWLEGQPVSAHPFTGLKNGQKGKIPKFARIFFSRNFQKIVGKNSQQTFCQESDLLLNSANPSKNEILTPKKLFYYGLFRVHTIANCVPFSDLLTSYSVSGYVH